MTIKDERGPIDSQCDAGRFFGPTCARLLQPSALSATANEVMVASETDKLVRAPFRLQCKSLTS